MKYNKLIKLSNYYYKLAQDTIIPENYEEDHESLLDFIDQSLNPDEFLFNFMSSYDDYLFTQPVDIRAIAEGLAGLMTEFTLSDGIKKFEILKQGLEGFHSGDLILKEMKQILLEDAKASFEVKNVENIIKCETLFSKSEIENILKQIMKLNPEIFNVVEYLFIYLSSKHINKNIIWRIIRDLDPYTFMQYNKTNYKSKNEVYKIDDVLKLINNGLPYSSFKNMIEQSTQQAKDMMRRMLWTAWHDNNTDTTTDYIDFMFDETMQPIDIDNRSVHIKDNWIIEQAKNVNNKKWVQQFSDYQLIPFPKTFNIDATFKYFIKKYSNNKVPELIQKMNGDKEWYFHGKLHREDGPALEFANGNKEWYFNGLRHREDGPAVEYANGDKEWYVNGKRHREDGPAVEHANGDKLWYLHGQLHRADGPAVEYVSGDKEWYLHGKRHRVDGPAKEYANGNKYWYLNGRLHREDGPAVELTNETKEWWFEGKKYPEIREEHIPVIKSYDPITKIKTYKDEAVDVDWTNTVRDAWIFDLDTLQLDRLPKLEEAYYNDKYPIAKLEDIESGNI